MPSPLEDLNPLNIMLTRALETDDDGMLHRVEIMLQLFSTISQFLKRFVMEHIDIKFSQDSYSGVFIILQFFNDLKFHSGHNFFAVK